MRASARAVSQHSCRPTKSGSTASRVAGQAAGVLLGPAEVVVVQGVRAGAGLLLGVGRVCGGRTGPWWVGRHLSWGHWYAGKSPGQASEAESSGAELPGKVHDTAVCHVSRHDGGGALKMDTKGCCSSSWRRWETTAAVCGYGPAQAGQTGAAVRAAAGAGGLSTHVPVGVRAYCTGMKVLP